MDPNINMFDDGGSLVGDESVILTQASNRAVVRGKFLFKEEKKLWVKGVTYGTFCPDNSGDQYGTPKTVAADFERIADCGLNAIRTYTVPPLWLLDIAHHHDIMLMVGIPWGQHLAFFQYNGLYHDIIRQVQQAIRGCARHPAILSYAIGNEIPASIVRWYGPRPIQRFLKTLYYVAKEADPDGLVTYVNFPTTEYLDLPFLDFVAFNVYLEARDDLEAYLPRVHNIAGDRPVIMAEIGLDSRRHGLEAQAASLDWQIRSIFSAGCAGGFVFAWTDEWHRGGHEIDDWDFGLVSRDRQPKPALAAVRKAFAQAPFGPEIAWPRVTVVICSYNGAATIRDTLEGMRTLDYPDFEVVVVDDGSTDTTAAIAAEYEVRLVRTKENRGLGSARNTGIQAASGEIIAFIDDDAYPDPHWLKFLVATLVKTAHTGVGGPNIAPPGDGPVADCVSNAPGRPMHVLLEDDLAEHIPGCNMAYWKACLEAVGGFDPRFRAAGDDVDLCWRLQERGWTIGFCAGAMDFHHHRPSIQRYWRQQVGYGRAEALLEAKWPEKYNTAGHFTWKGRIYGKGLTETAYNRRWRVYHGVWGSAPFQSMYQSDPGFLSSLPLMPEWYLVVALLGALTLADLLAAPLPVFLPLFLVALALPVVQAARSAAKARFQTVLPSTASVLKLRLLTAGLHLLQPLARLTGRTRWGLTLWRRRPVEMYAMPWPQHIAIWREEWRSAMEDLAALERRLRSQGAIVRQGGDFDSWDLEICVGMLGTMQTLLVVEEHGNGRQMVRLRAWPRMTKLAIGLSLLVVAFGGLAIVGQSWLSAGMLGILAIMLGIGLMRDCAAAAGRWLQASHVMIAGSEEDANAKGFRQSRISRQRWPLIGRVFRFRTHGVSLNRLLDTSREK